MVDEKKERRSFLKHFLAGSAVLAAGVIGAKPGKAEPKKLMRESDTLYHRSESFKKYYDSLRS